MIAGNPFLGWWNMRLKNILLVVSDVEQSKKFYHDLFDLQVINDNKDYVMMSEGLVLQGQKTWEQLIDSNTVIGNASELFFVENDFDAFLLKIKNIVEEQSINVRNNSWGKRIVMLEDPDGHLIEVAEA